LPGRKAFEFISFPFTKEWLHVPKASYKIEGQKILSHLRSYPLPIQHYHPGGFCFHVVCLERDERKPSLKIQAYLHML
jgi:hypothetical protein